MLHSLITKVKSLLKRKPTFSFGERDEKGFRVLYVDNKETKIKFYHFQGDDIERLKQTAQQLYEQRQI